MCAISPLLLRQVHNLIRCEALREKDVRWRLWNEPKNLLQGFLVPRPHSQSMSRRFRNWTARSHDNPRAVTSGDQSRIRAAWLTNLEHWTIEYCRYEVIHLLARVAHARGSDGHLQKLHYFEAGDVCRKSEHVFVSFQRIVFRQSSNIFRVVQKPFSLQRSQRRSVLLRTLEATAARRGYQNLPISSFHLSIRVHFDSDSTVDNGNQVGE
jgi:hypothetical protein